MHFWNKVLKTETCWLWTKPVTDKGYGVYFHGKKRTLAHRFSYEMANGPIPKGLVLDHLCRNTLCVNPDHLEAVTQKENVLRGFGIGAKFARRTHCNNGHEFNEKNTELRSDGGRRCTVCRAIRSKAIDSIQSRWSKMSDDQKKKSIERNRKWKQKHRIHS